MKKIGIFEAKTTFPGLCAEVAESRTPVLVQKRGRPLVVISPVPEELVQEREDIYSAWRKWEAENGALLAPVEDGEDFPEVWKMRKDKPGSPFEENE